MKVTLRKARKIETLAQQASITPIEPRRINTRKALDGDIPEISGAIQENIKFCLEDFSVRRSLRKIKSSINALIAEANHDSGIVRLMSERDDIKHAIREYRTFLDGASDMNAKDIMFMAEKDDKNDTTIVGRIRSFELPCLTVSSPEHTLLSDELFAMKEHLEKIEDRLMSINTTEMINIDDDDYAFLQTHRIVG